MAKQETVTITCDVCGEEIHGDYMLVSIDAYDFYVCIPRTAPINPCGNKTKRKLLEVFKHSDVADILLEGLDRTD